MVCPSSNLKRREKEDGEESREERMTVKRGDERSGGKLQGER
jgi:hypothetical protein